MMLSSPIFKHTHQTLKIIVFIYSPQYSYSIGLNLDNTVLNNPVEHAESKAENERN